MTSRLFFCRPAAGGRPAETRAQSPLGRCQAVADKYTVQKELRSIRDGHVQTLKCLEANLPEPTDKVDMRQLFASLDRDGDGRVSRKEWGKAVRDKNG